MLNPETLVKVHWVKVHWVDCWTDPFIYISRHAVEHFFRLGLKSLFR